MPRLPAPQRDLSQQAGNPTHAIQQHYEELMAIPDPTQLVDAVMQLLQPLVGAGFSEQNWRKFQMNLQQSARRGLTSIQSFLSNFMLKGSGLGVAEDRVAVVASLINEHVDDVVRLTDEQLALKEMVERHGFHVCCESTACISDE